MNLFKALYQQLKSFTSHRPPDSAQSLIQCGSKQLSYETQYVEYNIPNRMTAGATYGVRLTIENMGNFTWETNRLDGKNVDLVVGFENESSATHKLPLSAVAPGDKLTINFPLTSPTEAGRYTLRLELVHQRMALFADKGVSPLLIDIVVEEISRCLNIKYQKICSQINPFGYQPTRGISRSVDGRTYPLFTTRAKGCRLWDLEDKEYIDYVMGWGSVLLGYADDRIKETIGEYLETAPLTPLPHPVEMEVSQMLVDDFPCAEMVVFGKNGSDVCTVAARLSRIITGKRMVLYCGYHGWQDFWAEQLGFTKTGIPERPESLIHRFKFNDKDDFFRHYHKHKADLAAVMIEPAGPWGGDEVGPESDADKAFLETIAMAAREAGALLVFDEIVTNYRYPHGGVQRATEVIPDLACLGKAIASGMPLSALVGRAHIFQQGFPFVSYGPTFKGEIYSLAAAKASIQVYREEPVAEYVWKHGQKLKAEVNSLCRLIGIAAEMKGPPFRMALIFHDPDLSRYRMKLTLFQQELLKEGVMIYNGIMIPSYAHDDTTMEITLSAVAKALEVVAAAERKNDIERYLEIPLVSF